MALDLEQLPGIREEASQNNQSCLLQDGGGDARAAFCKMGGAMDLTTEAGAGMGLGMPHPVSALLC